MRDLRWIRMLVAAGCLLALAACGGEGGPLGGAIRSGEATAAATSAPKPANPVGAGAGNATGRCDVKVSGDLSLTAGGAGDLGTVLSRHWTTPEEQKVVAITRALQFACEAGAGADGVQAIFTSHVDASDKDVPYGPKRYTVASGTATADQFKVLLLVRDVPYLLQEPGALTITRWDGKVIAGNFQLTAREMLGVSGTPRTVSIEGTFEYPCTGSGACKR